MGQVSSLAINESQFIFTMGFSQIFDEILVKSFNIEKSKMDCLKLKDSFTTKIKIIYNARIIAYISLINKVFILIKN